MLNVKEPLEVRAHFLKGGVDKDGDATPGVRSTA